MGGSIHAYRVKEHYCTGCQMLAPARKGLAERKAPDGLSITLAPNR